MKIIHAADLHLDSPLRNLESYAGAPVDALRNATRRAFEKLTMLAIEESVALVLLAGDLYDSNWRDYNTGLFFHQQLSKLREANIEVVWLVGNHDAASEITKTLQAVQKLPNVHRLAEHMPDTVYLNKLDVIVHGQGFARKAITDNLALAYPKAKPGVFNIGMLHTSLDGRLGHDPYAPCKLDDLLSKNYDYWALGHIHQQKLINKDPWVAFPGNIQGRDIGETGAKGCLLIKVEDGQIQELEFKPLDVLRWRRCLVDVTGAVDEEAILTEVMAVLVDQDRFEWDGPEAVRLEVTGACKAHAAINRQVEHWHNELRAQATDKSDGRIWLEKIRLDTQEENLSLQRLATQEDASGLLLRTLRSMTLEDEIIKRLEKDLHALKTSLPLELKDEDWLKVTQLDMLHLLQEDVIRLLLPRLDGASTVGLL